MQHLLSVNLLSLQLRLPFLPVGNRGAQIGHVLQTVQAVLSGKASKASAVRSQAGSNTLLELRAIGTLDAQRKTL